MLEDNKPEADSSSPWGLWGTIFFGLLLVGVSIAVPGFIIGLLAAFTRPAPAHHDAGRLLQELQADGFLLSLGTIVSTVICCSALAVIIRLKKGASIREYLGLAGFNLRQALLWGGLLAALIITTDVSFWLLGLPLIPQFNISMYQSAKVPLLFWTAVLLCAPLWEESFFRGFLLKGLSASFLRPAGAVLITAAVWAGIHSQYHWRDIIPIFLFGCLLGAARVKTGSLSLTIAMHSLANLVSFAETIIYLTWVIH